MWVEFFKKPFAINQDKIQLMKTKKPKLIYLLMVLMAFQAISALPSAFMLIIHPSGELLGMPLSHLQHSPFHDFLIPGLFLFLMLGVMPLIIFIALVKPFKSRFFEALNIYRDKHWAWTFSYYTGIILVMWINLQLLMIRQWDFLHLFYSSLGLLVIVVVQYPSVVRYYEKIKIKETLDKNKEIV
jgi:hypothetical protein